jgi:acetoin utilization deacetylase AcuC-like enzyme
MTAPRPALFCIDDPRFDGHLSPSGHPECPERLSAVRKGLVAPLLAAGAELVRPREATYEEILRVHTEQHVQALEYALALEQGYLDADTFFSRGSRTAAWLAAGGAAELGERLARSHSAVAGVLTARPPGHHATDARAMGFCLINNVAVAAASALAAGLSRVVILDWDVHHGNGTQAIFEADPRVQFVSLHQWPQYPGTGKSEEIGSGDARGSTINLPLPTGSGSSEYGRAFRDVVLPRVRDFAPELVLVSCGFDAHADDPLGGMSLRDEDYGAFTSAVWQVVHDLGSPRLGIVLEGGYDFGALERGGASAARALLGTEHNPLGEGPVLGSAQRAIDATRRAHDQVTAR